MDYRISRSGNDIMKSNGANAFNNQRYDISAALLLEVYEETGDTMALYYSALSFIAEKEYEIGKELLSKNEIKNSSFMRKKFLDHIQN